MRCLVPELSIVEVFRDELITVLASLARESASAEQLACTAMELLIGIPTAAGQFRGLLRDLAGEG
ncbi:hypothetical protein [Streptomyces hoynatensis]|uniref:hypothetical protein n=1 Tax=Streptomyces hoynatensis TaxID=1141874 RepID=UPI001F4E986B|nr:hypothetical protein [Streptomyces hoynatensis]